MMNSIPLKSILASLLYFGFATVFTWFFVAAAPVYISREQMLLSTFIAGGKWGLQILAAFLLPDNMKWKFLQNISYVCFIGSVALMPYVILRYLDMASDPFYFTGSLAISVLIMIFAYYKAVKNSGAGIQYWYFWLLCLAIAITLQLTIVFHILNY
jgi:hypothetical protein